METNKNNTLAKQNYYTTKKRKVVDFLVGFVVALFMGFAIPYLVFLVMWYSDLTLMTRRVIDDISLISICGPSAIILFVVLMLKRKRKFIVIGAICGAIIPLFITGLCLLDPFNGQI